MTLGDEAIKVFVNASGTAENISPNLADFLSYLKTGMGDSSLVRKIDAQVKKSRAHEEWKVEYMTWQLKFHDIWDDAREEGYDEGYGEGMAKGMEDGRKKGIEEGRMEGLKGLIRLVEQGVISSEVAAHGAEMELEEFEKYRRKYQEEIN